LFVVVAVVVGGKMAGEFVAPVVVGKMVREFVAMVFDVAEVVDCCALSHAAKIKAVMAANEMASISDEKRCAAPFFRLFFLFS